VDGGHNSKGVGLAALGVVFGDIGTSPLYAVSLLFLHRGGALSPARIYGGISLVVWALVIIVALKYALLALKAENDGEGGVFALYGLLDTVNTGKRRLLGWSLLLGAGLLLGDGMITPAISVLSAVEGLAVATPWLAGAVVPVTLALLAALFWAQQGGTGRVGMVFGPVMLVWFAVISLLGLRQVVIHPDILRALSPVYGVRLLAGSNLGATLRVLGAVMLAVTGCEAMYADMGHFGASAIRKTWFAVVFPALLLNYLGQGAWLLGAAGQAGGQAGDGLFFRMVPAALVLPAVVLATMATVIASQALISGTFSLVKQGIALDFFPRLLIRHTHHARPGEVYVPFINWLLFAGCVALVLGFRSSAALGGAYGLAVSGVMLVTSVALLRVAIRVWHWNAALSMVLILPLVAVSGVFLFANSLKIFEGGYVPLGIGLAMFAVMLTWNWGRGRTHAAYVARRTVTMDEIARIHREATQFVERTAVLMVPPRANVGRARRVPALMQLLWSRYGVLPRNIIFVEVVHPRQPYVHEQRFVTQVLEQNANGSIVRVEMRFGFMEIPDVERGLELLAQETRIALEADHRKWIVHVVHEHLTRGVGMGVLAAIRFHAFELLRLISQPTYYHYGLGQDVQLTVEILPVQIR
jgi:KUP system potassium uptake protein